MTDGSRRTTGPQPRSLLALPAACRCSDTSGCRAFVVDSIRVADRPHRLRSTMDDRPRGHHRPPAAELPCRQHDPQLWFADAPVDLERAKELCSGCPVRQACLAVAVHRREYTGVWGGHIFERGRIVPRKRPRGRPRKQIGDAAPAAALAREQDTMISASALPGQHPDPMHAAAVRLHDAERALHVAHQSRVSTRIESANESLRAVVVEYLATAVDSPADSVRRQSAS